jgi:hypothetical protein
VGQRNLKLLVGQEKTDGRPDSRTDKLIPVYPPYNFVVRGYNKQELSQEQHTPYFLTAPFSGCVAELVRKYIHIKFQSHN